MTRRLTTMKEITQRLPQLSGYCYSYHIYKRIIHIDRLSVKLGVTKLLWKDAYTLEFRK